MIDWASFIIPLEHAPMSNGEVMKITQDGDIEWRTACHMQVQGSFDSAFSIRSEGACAENMASHLYLSGNPSKFLQGHNVFGSDDFISLVYATFCRICDVLKITPTDSELNNVRAGLYSVSRIDINYSFELPSRNDVRAWLRSAEYTSKTRHGRPQMKGGTLYHGKNSRRWSFKFYCKADEIEVKGHRLPEALMEKQRIENWVNNKLRAELTLRKLELERLNIKQAKDLTEIRVRQLFEKYIQRFDMQKQIRLSDKQILELPTRLKSTYILWQSGEDLRSVLPKATFYRHRLELKQYGIDITFPKNADEEKARNNVIPLIRVLEATPAEVPEWAYDHKLVYCR